MASFLLTHFTAMAGRIRDAVFRPQQGVETASTSESKPLIDDWNPMRDANSSESSKQTMMLSDGRQLGFAIYGASSGNTVFYFHGLGDCRITGAWFDQAGKQLGARIVGVDRPGLGLSSPLLNRTASDFADDIRQLAAHLEAKTYGIIGVSGGGPYALACAHELPKEELKSVAIVCGMGPFSMSMRHFNWAPWLLYNLYIMFPSVLRWTHGKTLAQLKNTPTEKFVQETRTKMRSWQTWPWRLIMPSNKDLSLFQDEYFLTLTFTALQESNKQGVEGFMGDWRVLASRNLGFELEEVRKDLPLQLWYGKQDANVPWKIGEEIARRLGNNARLYLKDEAHLSLILNWRYQMLEKVLERM